MPVYPMDIAGLHRELPICKVTDDLYIGAFICFGDAELTVACARDMLAMLEAGSIMYLQGADLRKEALCPVIFIQRKGEQRHESNWFSQILFQG